MLGWLGRCLSRWLVNQLASEPVNQLSSEQINRQTGKPANQQTSNKGSILIIALWALFLLGSLALAINYYVQPQLNLAAKLKNRVKMYYLAKSGIKRAILEMENDITDTYDALTDSWSTNDAAFKEVMLGDGMFSIVGRLADWQVDSPTEIRYGLIDEERKININKVSYEVLKNFFEIVGETTSQEASDIAFSVIDWRDEDDEPGDNGAEDGYYATLRPKYTCKNGDFEVLEEMLLVKGVRQDIFKKVKDKMTVYSEGYVNINTADELVLRALGMDEELARKIIRFRKGYDGIEGTEDDNIFDDVETIVDSLNIEGELSGDDIARLNRILSFGLLSVRSDNFRGYAIGRIKNRTDSVSISFVFNRNTEIMKYWREE